MHCKQPEFDQQQLFRHFDIAIELHLLRTGTILCKITRRRLNQASHQPDGCSGYIIEMYDYSFIKCELFQQTSSVLVGQL